MNDNENTLILPWSDLLYAGKDELLDLYKEQKKNGVTVYFQNQEGLWRLNGKAEAELIQK